MSNRTLIRRIHGVAGITGMLTVGTFWSVTVVTELFGSHATVAAAKGAILWGMLILVPAMIGVGASGFTLGGKSTAPVILAKKRRMPVIALNGLLVLVPAAFFLASRAAAGAFDRTFYLVQAIELIAGATNLGLMSLSIRDGLAMRRRTSRMPKRHDGDA